MDVFSDILLVNVFVFADDIMHRILCFVNLCESVFVNSLAIPFFQFSFNIKSSVTETIKWKNNDDGDVDTKIMIMIGILFMREFLINYVNLFVLFFSLSCPILNVMR